MERDEFVGPVVSGVRGKLVLVAGATSTSGHAATHALVFAGARVIAVGRDAERLQPLADLGATAEVCELTDEGAVLEFAARAHQMHGRVDGILHLVGGWRGGGGLAGQTDGDFRFLERSLTALRHVSRAFDDDLRASDAGRLAIVSSTTVGRPLAGGATLLHNRLAGRFHDAHDGRKAVGVDLSHDGNHRRQPEIHLEITFLHDSLQNYPPLIHPVNFPHVGHVGQAEKDSQLHRQLPCCTVCGLVTAENEIAAVQSSNPCRKDAGRGQRVCSCEQRVTEKHASVRTRRQGLLEACPSLGWSHGQNGHGSAVDFPDPQSFLQGMPVQQIRHGGNTGTNDRARIRIHGDPVKMLGVGNLLGAYDDVETHAAPPILSAAL